MDLSFYFHVFLIYGFRKEDSYYNFFNLPHLEGNLVSTRPKGGFDFFFSTEFSIYAAYFKNWEIRERGGSPGRGF